MPYKAISKKLRELDVFSGIAILFVTLIHSNAYYLSNILRLQTYVQAGFLVRLLNNLVYSAVPMFIFIAGYKYALNNTNDKYKTFIVKKMRSVLKPFIVISIIFLIKNIIIYREAYTSINAIITAFVNIFLGTNAAYQLWFIPMYIFISITYPIIYKAFKRDRSRVLCIISILLIQRMLGMRFHFLNTQFARFVYYFLFYEMGVLFLKYNIKDKIKEYNKYLISSYLILLVINSIILDQQIHKWIQMYLLSFLSIATYYFISMKLEDNKVLQYLGKYSFYIYLFHEPIVLTYIATAIKAIGVYNSILYVFIIAIASIIASIIIYKVIENSFLRYLFFNSTKK